MPEPTNTNNVAIPLEILGQPAEWVMILIGFGPVIIGLFIVHFARKEWRVSQRTLALEILKKRVVFYVAALKIIARATTEQPDTQYYNEYSSAIRDREFYFDDDFNNLLEQIGRNYLALWVADQYMRAADHQPGIDRVKHSKEWQEKVRYFAHVSEKLRKTAAPYMNFSDVVAPGVPWWRRLF